MPAHELDTTSFDLEPVDGVFAGESIEFRFQVTIDGTAKDITEDTLEFEVFDRAYESSDLVLSDSDAGVEIIDTDPLADLENGKFRVRINEGVTDDLYGEYFAKPRVIPPESTDTMAEWRIRTLIDA